MRWSWSALINSAEVSAIGSSRGGVLRVSAAPVTRRNRRRSVARSCTAVDPRPHASSARQRDDRAAADEIVPLLLAIHDLELGRIVESVQLATDPTGAVVHAGPP